MPPRLAASPVRSLLLRHGYVPVALERTAVGLLTLTARINGIAARVVLDTGASTTVVDRGVAGRYRLAIRSVAEKAGGIGTSNQSVGKGTIGLLRLGRLQLRRVPIAAIDLHHVNASLEAAGAEPVVGVIGGDILAARGAVIDYGSATLFLKRGSA